MENLFVNLRRLGFTTYQGYLASPYWADVRARYLSSGRPTVCAVCGSAKTQLHHVTYLRLGAEEFGDLMPLCKTHHKAVHRWLRRNKLAVEQSLTAVTFLRLARAKRRRRKL